MADETNRPNANTTPPGATEPEAKPAEAAAPDETKPALDPAKLAAEVETLHGQIADLTDRLLRAHADIDNLRKRLEREKEETAKYAITRFAREVVTVADNFERAVQAVPAGAAEKDAALKALVEGVNMTEREFINVLERNGVRRVVPKGETFNPHQHQAMMELQNPEVAPGTILEVFQPGYLIDERVLRPAMVVVAKGGQKPTKADSDQPASPSSNEPPQDGNDE
jgi:molecular chaperone GrpE